MDIKRIDANAKLRMYETSKKETENLKNNADANKTAQKAENYDKINISQEAKNLNILDFANSKIRNEMIKELADINNSEKINALREQIKNGEYDINSKDVAFAIISGGSGV